MIHFVVLYYYNTFTVQYSFLGYFMLRHFVTAAKTSETSAPFGTKLYQVIYISGIVARKMLLLVLSTHTHDFKRDLKIELPVIVTSCTYVFP